MGNATLAVDLQDGFHGEHVTVWVNGQVAFDRDVTSSLLTGLAASVTVSVLAGTAIVRTVVVDADQICEVQLSDGERCYLGISLEDRSVACIRSARPFFYG